MGVVRGSIPRESTFFGDLFFLSDLIFDISQLFNVNVEEKLGSLKTNKHRTNRDRPISEPGWFQGHQMNAHGTC